MISSPYPPHHGIKTRELAQEVASRLENMTGDRCEVLSSWKARHVADGYTFYVSRTDPAGNEVGDSPCMKKKMNLLTIVYGAGNRGSLSR